MFRGILNLKIMVINSWAFCIAMKHRISLCANTLGVLSIAISYVFLQLCVTLAEWFSIWLFFFAVYGDA